MNNLSRRRFMKGLAGVVAGVSVLKAEEPKYEVSCDPGAKDGSKSVTKEYDLIADLVEEMNNFDKMHPNTHISYSIHCNYTGLAFLNDTGELDKDVLYRCGPAPWVYTHYLWIPYKLWLLRRTPTPVGYTSLINVMLVPLHTIKARPHDLQLIAETTERCSFDINAGIHNHRSLYELISTRCFNVNRNEEGKIIAGLEDGQVFCKSERRVSYDKLKQGIYEEPMPITDFYNSY